MPNHARLIKIETRINQTLSPLYETIQSSEKSVKTLVLLDCQEKSVCPILEPVWEVRKCLKLRFIGEKCEGKFWGTTIGLYGVPSRIIIDNGSNLNNNMGKGVQCFKWGYLDKKLKPKTITSILNLYNLMYNN